MARAGYATVANDVPMTPNSVVSPGFAMPENGWLTGMGVSVGWQGFDDNRVRIGLWNSAGSRVAVSAAFQVPQNFNFRTMALPNVRAGQGDFVYPGAYALPGTGVGIGYAAQAASGSPYVMGYAESTGNPPGNIGVNRAIVRAYSGYVDYAPNAAPSKGSWRTAYSGIVTDPTPLFEGTMPHGNGDGDYDYSEAVHLIVWPTNDPTKPLYDNIFGTTQQEVNQGYFSRDAASLGFSLTAGVTYSARFGHIDSWKVGSPASNTITFTAAKGPSHPTNLSPKGKVNAVSGLAYHGDYDHPSGVPCDKVELYIANEANTALVHGPQVFDIADIAPGQRWGIPQWHPALLFGTGYFLFGRAIDKNGFPGPYAGQAFRTNAPPSIPTNLSPSEGKRTPVRRFTCSVSDPDGDTVTAAQIEIVDPVNGVPIPDAGGNTWRQMTVSGGTATYEATPANLPINKAYRYRMRARDAFDPGYGTPTGYVQFVLTEVPIVELLSPYPDRRNRVPQPSAEYDPAGLSSYWTQTAEGLEGAIERVVDGDAASGVASWRASTSAISDNRFVGGFIPVDASRPCLALASYKKESGASAAHFALLCYDGAGNLLGTAYPRSVRLAQGDDVPRAWTTYGGIVWPAGSSESPALPAGTTRVKPEATPSRASAAAVRPDAFFFDQPPAGLKPADWASVSAWHGYADGDEEGYGEGGYSWSGPAGNSESLILPVLTAPGSAIAISYTHNSGLSKAADRVVVEKREGARLTQTGDTGWVSSARTVIPTPAGALRNEGRYVVTVYCRDTGGSEGQADPVEFDVRYEGPPEPSIAVRRGDPDRGELVLETEPTALDQQDFAGREVEVWATDGSEGAPFVYLLSLDPNETKFTYPFPVSTRTYRMRVRDIKNLGAEQVESRWATTELSVDHGPYNFFKDARDPSVFVRFQHPSGSSTEPELDTPGSSHLPWGSETTVRFVGSARLREGKTQFVLWPDGVYSVDERYKTMLDLLERRPTVCLLTRLPRPGKVFASILGKAPAGVASGSYPKFEFGWEKTLFPEDHYQRFGDA